jgi:hypothetical protein
MNTGISAGVLRRSAKNRSFFRVFSAFFPQEAGFGRFFRRFRRADR